MRQNKAGPSSGHTLKKPTNTSRQAPQGSATRLIRPTVFREPVTGLREEAQTVTQSLHVRYEPHGDKYKNWDLKPVRLILLIEDSNLDCIPPINNDKVEVNCYPGANPR